MKTKMDSHDCSLDANIWNEMAMLAPFHMANTIYPLQTTPMSDSNTNYHFHQNRLASFVSVANLNPLCPKMLSMGTIGS